MVLTGKYGSAEIFAEIIDAETIQQVYEILNCPISENANIRIMPDCHAGAGCVIGTTMKILDKVCPNVVGVDLGCGIRTSYLGHLEVDFSALDSFIKQNIPSGREANQNSSRDAEDLVSKLRCKDYLANYDHIIRSLGTLGGGNHFIEIDVATGGAKYLLIHSGSRNLGLQVAKYYQALATRHTKTAQGTRMALIASLRSQGREKEIEGALRALGEQKREWPESLDFLTGKDMEDYLFDAGIAQTFARKNRSKIASLIRTFLGLSNSVPNLVCDSVHNYVDMEDMVLRKGATRAQAGDQLVIPINMKDGSLLCLGKGNAGWNYSAPHGAGRVMSRRQAKDTLQVTQFKNDMAGIFTTTANQSTIDESPRAYKPIEAILGVIEPTVEILDMLHPIYNFKAGEDN